MVTSDMARVRELQYNDRFMALNGTSHMNGIGSGRIVDPRLSSSLRLELLTRHQQGSLSSHDYHSEPTHFQFH
jgi:hypothetical protein